MTRIKKLIPSKVKSYLKQFILDHFDGYATKSYSQEGEDMILRSIFSHVEKGFYVDIGAHHPKRLSNTCYFYKRGWRGINIDARPDSMKEFMKTRPRDINIEAAVDKERRKATYHMYDEPAVNSFVKELSPLRDAYFKLIDTKTMVTRRLDDILDQYLPAGQSINFMNVDVEGMDLNVLMSNNWKLYRPDYLLVEIAADTLECMQNDDIYKFMQNEGYDFYTKTVRTIIFRSKHLYMETVKP